MCNHQTSSYNANLRRMNETKKNDVNGQWQYKHMYVSEWSTDRIYCILLIVENRRDRRKNHAIHIRWLKNMHGFLVCFAFSHAVKSLYDEIFEMGEYSDRYMKPMVFLYTVFKKSVVKVEKEWRDKKKHNIFWCRFSIENCCPEGHL